MVEPPEVGADRLTTEAFCGGYSSSVRVCTPGIRCCSQGASCACHPIDLKWVYMSSFKRGEF